MYLGSGKGQDQGANEWKGLKSHEAKSKYIIVPI